MTPTPTVLLIVALFWTLPASALGLLYREDPIEAAPSSLNKSVERAHR
jgi:hypothetical protein